MPLLANESLFREACYVNGEWIQSDSSETVDVFNPSDGNKIGSVPNCGTAETEQAINAAEIAFKDWRARSAKERSDILWAFARQIDDNKADLAKLMTIEQGKPITEARTEVDYANSFIKWFAEEARRVYGDIIPSNKRDQRLLVIKQPIGVVAAITPWNFPLAMITRKIGPALAVGCTAVVKPAPDTPFSALALAVLAEQAGIPKGVFNVITGDAQAIGGELTRNPIVRKLSFTGSTAVGKILMSQCAATVKKVSLELGGNAPFIVFDDADLDAAVEGAIISKFRNTGQTCVCANRLFVQDGVYDAFTAKLVKAVKQLKVGDGLDEQSQQGPLINQKGLEKVKEHVADAVAHGGKILCGGKSHALGGLFFEPTVIADATPAMRLAKEETFGPVAPLFRFTTVDQVIDMANDTNVGLASYFYSQNINRVFHVAEQLQYGMVGINTGLFSTEVAPFGGVKESGLGREGSKYGIDDYVEIKYMCVG